MIDKDIILVEEIEEISDNIQPLVAIARMEDGSLGFETVLSSPRQLLKVLRAVENKILEDYFG